MTVEPGSRGHDQAMAPSVLVHGGGHGGWCPRGRLWDIGTGHDLVATAPPATTRALLEVADA